jgi:citrate lyase beta subunit
VPEKYRSRRSCLAVPGSSQRFLDKARGLAAISLPKVTGPGHVIRLDLIPGQIEQDTGGEAGRIGIEAQIEDARGLAKMDEIAAASPRLRALVFGPADFLASAGMRSQRFEPAGEGSAEHAPRDEGLGQPAGQG